MVERIRCPNCGAINYGDVKKCWKCGASLTPQGEQPPGAPPPPPPKPTLEETLPQKVPRIKYPILYPIGALIFVVGMVLGVFLLYLLVDAPEEIRNNYDDEHAVFAATQDFPVTVMGEVTAVSKDTDEYGYYLYELDGDGVIKEKVVSDSIQPDDDLIVRSKKPTLAKEGDKVMWEVDKKSNDVGQDYLVVTDVKNPTLYRIPGVVIAIFGVILIVIGYVGIPD
ncbi:MAG: hypothetical protein J7L88_06590, partial [Thermoplasmata archaeon]|nr:hypothetical protein [Thermoplasmata archaeon]